MSVKSVVDFYNKIVDDEFEYDFSEINKDTLNEDVFHDKILPAAKKHGYDFTYEDVRDYYDSLGGAIELSEDDLENVSGGDGCSSKKPQYQEVSLNDSAEKCRWYISRTSHGEKVCGNCIYCNNEQGKFYCEQSA